MKKSDVIFHKNNLCTQPYAAINLKIYGIYGKTNPPYEDMHYMFTREWVEKHISEETFGYWWECTCQELGEKIINEAHRLFPGVKAWIEGRSGGWLAMEFTQRDVEAWDAIDLGKWRTLCKFVDHCKGIFSQTLFKYIYENEFMDWLVERRQNEENLITAQG